LGFEIHKTKINYNITNFDIFNNKIYFTTENSLFSSEFDFINSIKIFDFDTSCYINEMKIDTLYGNIFLSGVYNENSFVKIFNIKKNIIKTVFFNDLFNDYLLINSFYIDKFNNYWFGTFGNGVYTIKNYFFVYNINFHSKLKAYVNDVYESINSIYAATNRGLFIKKIKDHSFREFKINNHSCGYVRKIDKFKNGIIFVSMYNQEFKSEYFKFVVINNDSICLINSRFFCFDTINDYLFVDHYLNNYYVYKIKNNNVIKFKLIPKSFLGNDAYLQSVKFIDNVFFICTTNGLLITDKNFNKVLFSFSGANIFDVIYFNKIYYFITEKGVYYYDFIGKFIDFPSIQNSDFKIKSILKKK
jgi:hypothetical protein